VLRAGVGVLGAGFGAAKATASATLGDLVGSRPAGPLDERDPDFIRQTLPVYRQITRLYFRPRVRGLEHIPPEGPVLLVGNHSGGTLIADTFVFAYEFYRRFGPRRRFHQLAHDVAVELPAVSALLRKYGTVAASHENAEAALEAGAAVLVYPGGDYESFRPSWHSARIEFGGRSGFVRLALAQDVPIVPVVAIGGQETALFLTRGQRLARLLALDRLLRIKVLPVALAPPFGLSAMELPPRVPLPAQVTIEVLPPLELREQFGPDPDEEEVYEALTETMQEALDRLAAERDLPLVGPVRGPG
jgi:1-acyl-sn-glycerol-3-phosphate acyltransferase